MKKDWKKIAGVLLGLSVITVVVFANQLGLDNNPTWEIKRFAIFLAGVLIAVMSLFYKHNNFIGRLFNTRTGQLYLATGILGGVILLAYAWCVSLGLWTKWPASSNYYDLLATAFRHGQLALETEPDPALTALQNPYDPANRTWAKGIPILWDASLYKGKYYLYFGPVPSVVLAAVKFFYTREVGDNVLTYLFIAGLFIFATLIILDLWTTYFDDIPRWAVLISIVLVGLVNPVPFVLLYPRIYEAAVSSGQFFFIGGLYFLLIAFKKPSTLRLGLAGIFFTCAVGSRTIILLPTIFLAVVVLVWVIREHREQAISFLAVFTIPLAIGATTYAWYNYARFGSFTEFGYTYQLTGINIQAGIKDIFSLLYIPPNLFKTLINPLEVRSTFPFILPITWNDPAWFKGYHPKIYHYLSANITGLLTGTPFLLLAFFARPQVKKNIFWIFTSLAGSTLLIFFTLQIFFYMVMRYLLDLIPALSLLAVLGFLQGIQLLQTRQIPRYIFNLISLVLWAYTIAISFLLIFSNNQPRFKSFNPDLFTLLEHAFNSLLK